MFEPGALLGQPLQRVGYSDRTAWLMAAMSELAYLKFEEAEGLAGLLDDLARFVGRERSVVSAALEPLLDAERAALLAASGEERLRRILDSIGFDLLRTFSFDETQAFLARRRSTPGAREMMVLAFRGTEKKLRDWKTDLRAALVAVGGREGRIHGGFLAAWNAVRAEVEAEIAKHADAPLFVTGHSLGGALAVVATRFLPAERLAACYTFGGPRVGDRDLSHVFKTPIYRVVNASDAVPRVPFGSGIWFVAVLLTALVYVTPRWRVIDALHGFVDRVTGYVHYGDMRYLTGAAPGPGHNYPGLMVIANPGFVERARRFLGRVRDTRGQGPIRDHAIGIYRRKLAAYALARNPPARDRRMLE